MDTEYALLDTYTPTQKMGFLHRGSTPAIAHMNDPAKSILIDFTKVLAQTIPPHEKVQQALLNMQYGRLKFLLVIDNEEKLVGLVSSKDLQGIKPGRAAQKSNINLTDVTVGMVMKPIDELQAISYSALSNACVGHIAKIIHEKGVEHLLVIHNKRKASAPMVRGIFAAGIISQYLGENISGDLSSDNLADIQKRTTK